MGTLKLWAIAHKNRYIFLEMGAVTPASASK
jgi:hypothetical protein